MPVAQCTEAFSASPRGQAAAMTELMDEPNGSDHEPDDDDLLDAEEEKGYGKDEGEREEPLPPE